jgi:putative tryptophan/tyrosine transport system substrate-binding protein
MRRREFITLLGGAAAAWPVAARAQQAAMPVIGYLSGWSSMTGDTGVQEGLKEIGLVEGRDFAIARSIGGQTDRLPAIVADVVARHVTVILAVSDLYALAAKAATTEVPIVFIGGNDPVSIGLVTSLNRPGGNVTGVTVLNVEIAAKRLQVLNELIPTAASFAALLEGGAGPNLGIDTRNLTAAARALGLQVHILQATNPNEIDLAFETVAQQRLGPLVIGPSAFFNVQSQQLAALTVRYAVPAIFQTREFVSAGGLMSYGGSLLDAFRIAGSYTGRILKGEKPANLPVQQVSKFELFINLKTAKALGLDVPPTLLARADEVIE